MLVHPDGDPEVVVAEADAVGGDGYGAAGRRAAVVHVGEGQSRQAETVDHRVRVVDRVAAPDRELDLRPLDIGVGQSGANGQLAQLDRRPPWETSEGVQPHTDDGNLGHGVRQLLCGRKAKVIRSLPSSSVEKGTTVSSIGAPIRTVPASTSTSWVSIRPIPSNST